MSGATSLLRLSRRRPRPSTFGVSVGAGAEPSRLHWRTISGFQNSASYSVAEGALVVIGFRFVPRKTTGLPCVSPPIQPRGEPMLRAIAFEFETDAPAKTISPVRLQPIARTAAVAMAICAI